MNESHLHLQIESREKIAKLNLGSTETVMAPLNSVDALVAIESTLGKSSSRPMAILSLRLLEWAFDTSTASQIGDSTSANNATHPDLLLLAYTLVDHFRATGSII